MRHPIRLLAIISTLLALAAPVAAQPSVTGVFARVKFGTCTLRSGSGSPESSVTGSICDVYVRTDTGAMYSKTSGSGNTGWTLLATGGSGTVTSIALTMPGIFSVSGSPVTSSGTISASLATQSANRVFAGPTTGSAAQPTFRTIVFGDWASNSCATNQIPKFDGAAWVCGDDSGTGSPIGAQYLTLATDGTLTNERVLTAGTGVAFTDGGAGSTLTVAADGANITSLSAANISAGTLAVARGGTNLTSATDDNVMVGNGTTWQSKTIPDCDNATTSKLLYDQTTNAWSCGTDQAGAGTVTGPGSSTDNAIVRFDGTGGSTLQDSALTLGDTGALSFPDGIRQTFNPDATNAGINVGSLSGDPSSPSNGDLWYDSSANELTARINGANVALGSGGGTPTCPSGASPSMYGCLLEHHAASSSSSVDFTSCISSTYDVYHFEFVSILPATDAVVFKMLMSTNAGSTYDTSGIYGWSYNLNLFTGSTGNLGEGNNNDTFIQLGGGQLDSDTAYGISGHLDLYNPLSASVYKQGAGQFVFKDNRDSISSIRNEGFIYKSATAVNAVRFIMSSGNVASGTIYCFGLAKSDGGFMILILVYVRRRQRQQYQSSERMAA